MALEVSAIAEGAVFADCTITGMVFVTGFVFTVPSGLVHLPVTVSTDGPAGIPAGDVNVRTPLWRDTPVAERVQNRTEILARSTPSLSVTGREKFCSVPDVHVFGPVNSQNVRGVSGAYALFTICVAV